MDLNCTTTPEEIRSKGENENEFIVLRYKNGAIQRLYETIIIGSETAAEVGETSTQTITITRKILAEDRNL